MTLRQTEWQHFILGLLVGAVATTCASTFLMVWYTGLADRGMVAAAESNWVAAVAQKNWQLCIDDYLETRNYAYALQDAVNDYCGL